MKKTVYQEQGYKNRMAYLSDLAEDFGVDYGVILAMSEALGDEEDFDGLVTALEDAESTGNLNGY